jgi:lactate dehydrogenase-like 2-hydroxyacid dehydrogenase
MKHDTNTYESTIDVTDCRAYQNKARMVTVAIYGRGQLGYGVAELLQTQQNMRVLGPYSRADREMALTLGAEVVVIASRP